MTNHQDILTLTDTCKKASTWLSARIDNEEIEHELLETAKTFVIGRYNMESLKDSAEEDITPKVPETGILVLTVTSDCVREVSNGKGGFQSLSVTIVDAAAENYVIKIIRSSTRTEKVHYVPVSGSNDKIIFCVKRSNAPLGSYVLHIDDLITKNRTGKNDSINDFDRWEKFKSADEGYRSEIHIEAQFISTILSGI